MEVKDLAEVMAASFEGHKRDNGDKILTIREHAPKWVQDVVHAGHMDGSEGGMLPDDHRYQFCLEAAEALAEAYDPDEINLEPEIYTSELTRWLASHNGRIGYVDEAVAEYGHVEGIFDALQLGHLAERQEVLQLVRDALGRVAAGKAVSA